MSRLSRIGSAVERALVGSERLSPEIEAATRQYVTSAGRINEQALGKRKLLGDLLIGKKGTLGALKARYRQGGVIGPGGLVMGELAIDPKYKDLVRAFREAPRGTSVVDPYTGKLVSKGKAARMLATKGIGQGINPMFLLGFPALDVASAISTPDSDIHGGTSGILGALGGGLGFAVAGPLGLVGGLGASHIGQSLGQSVGSLFDPAQSLTSNSVPPSMVISNSVLDAAIPT